jgi:hypothetical protein
MTDLMSSGESSPPFYRGLDRHMYIRMLTIPCGQRPDWEAAQAEFERLEAEGEYFPWNPVDRLRYVLEHPEETGLQAFAFRGQAFYLAIGHEYDPTEALASLREVFETDILYATGLREAWTDMAEKIGPDGLFPAGLDQ